MTESELRADIAGFDAGLEILWIGDIVDDGNLEAIVQDGWGQYRYPWLKTVAATCGAPYTEGVGRPALLAVQRDIVPRKLASPAESSTSPLAVASRVPLHHSDADCTTVH